MQDKIIHFSDSFGTNYKFKIAYPHSIEYLFEKNQYAGFICNFKLETGWIYQKIVNNVIKWHFSPWMKSPSNEAINYIEQVLKKYSDNKVFL